MDWDEKASRDKSRYRGEGRGRVRAGAKRRKGEVREMKDTLSLGKGSPRASSCIKHTKARERSARRGNKRGKFDEQPNQLEGRAPSSEGDSEHWEYKCVWWRKRATKG